MFYAFDWRYGINTTDEEGNPIGRACAFSRRCDRDKWVSEGSRRSVISQREALRSMAADLLSYLGCVYYDGTPYPQVWEIIQHVPARDIVDMFEQVMNDTEAMYTCWN